MRDFHYSLLRSHGFVLGPRDPNMNTAFKGQFMVSEQYPPGYSQPDGMGGDGVWCIVGDDYDTLLAEAVTFHELEGSTLKDWENETAPSIEYVVETEPDQVNVVFADGTKVWIERQAGRIRVHCFDTEHETPVNVEIEPQLIRVDADEYRLELT